MSRSPRWINRRRPERRREAAERQRERDARTDEEQIRLLRTRPGKSEQEIDRLRARCPADEREVKDG